MFAQSGSSGKCMNPQSLYYFARVVQRLKDLQKIHLFHLSVTHQATIIPADRRLCHHKWTKCKRWEMKVGNMGSLSAFLTKLSTVIPSEILSGEPHPPAASIIESIAKKLVVGYRQALNCHLRQSM